MSEYTARILTSISDVDRSEWDALFNSSSEGYDYLLACEQAQPEAFNFYAIGVFDGDRLVAGSPVFRVEIRLDMLLEGTLRTLAGWLYKRWPNGLTISLIGLGSPHADELPLGFSSELTPDQKRLAASIMTDCLMAHAVEKRVKIALLKNITEIQDQWIGESLLGQSFSVIPSIPMSTLAIADSEAEYIQSLSANMRSNIRRKLKKAADIRVEIRDSAEGINDEIVMLRNQTRARAKAEYGPFEEVSPDFFQSVLEKNGTNAKLLLYWHKEQLIGFALALIGPDKVKEKYTGMRYPEALDHGVFFLNWMSMVRLCIEHDLAEFHAGETTYLTKARLGCRFEKSWIYIKHTNSLINKLLHRISPFIAIDKTDPDLKLLGDKAPYKN